MPLIENEIKSPTHSELEWNVKEECRTLHNVQLTADWLSNMSCDTEKVFNTIVYPNYKFKLLIY